MRVRFNEIFDYRPSGEPRIVVRYRPNGGPARDGIYTVKRECGLAARAEKKATVVRPPRGGGDAQRG